MNRSEALFLILMIFILVSCSESNIFMDVEKDFVAVCRDRYFLSVQEAIDYLCSAGSKDVSGDSIPDENTIYVLVDDFSGPGLCIPAAGKNIKIEFNDCIYTVTDDSEIAVDIEESDDTVVISNATFIIRQSNSNLEYVYRIKADFSQSNVAVDDRRNVTKDNCTAFSNSQKVYIATGKTVSFGAEDNENSTDNVVGWLTIDDESQLSLISGSYTFWGINCDGDMDIEDNVSINIFSVNATTVRDASYGTGIVHVNIMDAHEHDYISMTRGETCTDCACTYEQCTVCGDCRNVIETGSAPEGHEHDGTWHTDGDCHWRVCTVCGEAFNEHAHTFSTIIDTQTDVCTICGYSKPSSNPVLPPTPGTGSTSGSGNGGFNVTIKNRVPAGSLSAVDENDDNNWVITLTDENTSYPVKNVKWILDNEYMTEFNDSNEFVLENPQQRTYFIDCVISNDYGTTTLEIVVRGKRH